MGPRAYFSGLKEQILLVFCLSGKAVGFMSFRFGNKCGELKNHVPANYVTTVCVSSAARGKGVCTKFYNFLLSGLPQHLRSPFTATRTWNSNDSHLKILDKLGFKLITTLKNHRDKGVDTVYYARRSE